MDTLPKLPPLPESRKEKWVDHGHKVVVVMVDKKGEIKVIPGHICCWDQSHGTDDDKIWNVTDTIVWSDGEPFHPGRGNCADDECTEVFEFKDPRLLTFEEARVLWNVHLASKWFEKLYSTRTIEKICARLLLCDPVADDMLMRLPEEKV